MKNEDLFDELDNCFDVPELDSVDVEKRENLLIALGKCLKQLLSECNESELDITFGQTDSCTINAISYNTQIRYKFGILFLSYSFILEIYPRIMPNLNIIAILQDKHKCLIYEDHILKGWAIEIETEEIYLEAKSIINKILITT